MKHSNLSVLFIPIAALALISGCATSSAIRPLPKPEVIASDIRDADAQVEPEPHSEVPMEINEDVQKWIDYFAIKDRVRFESFLLRGEYYRETIEAILTEHQVPRDMYYLAMIESGFMTQATSHASAVGVWQFIRATGRRYGMRQSAYLDERRDVIQATHAAARYLRDLHQEFGSWYLAMAAYNAGEGRIRRAIRIGRSRDFWVLVQKRVLPRETKNYVPKFLAAWIIGRKPAKFGFELPEQIESRYPNVEKATVPGSVHLNEIARVLGLEPNSLAPLNPHLIHGITPPEKTTYDIWVPQGQAAQLLAPEMPLARVTNPAALLPVRYRVRTGDTLEAIAKRHRISLASLKRLNGLDSDRIYRGQSLKVRPSSS